MNVLGLSAFYHESSCCLLRDGELVAAASEERFSRVKHDPRLPVRAFRYCLEAGGLGIGDLDCLAYYESPWEKHARQRAMGLPRDRDEAAAMDPEGPFRAIRERLGFAGSIETFAHHLSHAASAFHYSGFDEAAVLVVDGVGEWATTTYGSGAGSELDLFEEVRFPHSLGLLYATLTSFLGFRVNSGEYKVMGLAPYGRPRLVGALRRLIESSPGGQFRLDLAYFDFANPERMFREELCDLLGGSPREPEGELTSFHRDVAASLQRVLEEILLEKAGYLATRVGARDLCLAGGVALNCVANGRIHREGPFERLFVQPAAGDAGGCLGAAALAHLRLTGRRHTREPMTGTRLGPETPPEEMAELVAAAGIEASDYRGREAELLEEVAGRLARNQIVGWHQGRMEFGPRALGGRSLLANPMDPEARERLNREVKGRESFRPFAPSVLAEEAAEHFELSRPSPFMTETCRVRSHLLLPAITHVDGSARPQMVERSADPRFHALLEAFHRKTGCPVLLNTSLNLRGEPIACSPVDSLFCLARGGIDALALGDHLIERDRLPSHWERLVSDWVTRPGFAFGTQRSAIAESLYSFV